MLHPPKGGTGFSGRAYICRFSQVSRPPYKLAFERGITTGLLGELTIWHSNTKIRVMDKSDNDTSEVKSYFISGLLSGLGNLATTAGSAIANGAGHVASALGNIPVVGNVLQGGVSSLGNGLGQVVSGNLGGGLSSLYTGADKLLGGILPGGQAVGAGYLGNMYGAADRALGGYLPNIGGVGATPVMMNGSALAQMQNAGAGGHSMFQDPRLLNGKPFDPSSRLREVECGGILIKWHKLRIPLVVLRL